MNFVVNTDGASRGNPGKAAYGYIIKSSGGPILHQEGKTIGVATNNIAEYSGIIAALGYIAAQYRARAPHVVEVVCDSQLAAQQLSGNYKVKNSEIKKLFDRVKVLEIEIGQVSYRYVPRAENFIADRLANKALDGER